MSGRIWLTADPNSVPLDRGPSTLWVHPDRRPAPKAARTLTATQYLDRPWDAIRGADTLVVVGMTEIVTPANRVKTGPYLNEPFPNVVRHSVDRTLFIGEPWRAWWHWGCVQAPWEDVPHSFCLEGRWNQAMEGRREDPCSLDVVLRIGRGVVTAMPDAPRFGEIEVQVIPQPEEVHAAYLEEKRQAFETETTWRGLIRRLGAFAQHSAPSRYLPTGVKLFRHMDDLIPLKIVATDLAVDTWLLSQLRQTVSLVDEVAKAFRWTP